MKETKNFFDNNKLNKGYSKVGREQQKELKSAGSGDYYNNMLPPIDVIEMYEELYPGVTQKLFDMAQQEQKHKHHLELASLKQHEKLNKLGKLAAVIFISVISITTLILAEHSLVASVFALSAFLSVIVCLSFYYSKSQIKKNWDTQEHRKNKFYNRGSKNNRKFSS